MITYADGDIFEHDGVRVIPVNTVGIHGSGLAKQWAVRFPDLAGLYRGYCAAPLTRFEAGDILMLGGNSPTILAATKEHWRDPSRLEWIETIAGLIAERSHKPIGMPVLIPQLGCGLGGLNWDDVRPILVTYLTSSANTYVLFGPPAVQP